MGDEERFCSQCGTRRAVIPTDAGPATVPAAPARPEQPPNVTPPAPVRPIRSTAEIMPIRMTPPAAPPPPPQEPVAVQREEPELNDSVVPWPTEERVTAPRPAAPEPPVVREPEPSAAHESG